MAPGYPHDELLEKVARHILREPACCSDALKQLPSCCILRRNGQVVWGEEQIQQGRQGQGQCTRIASRASAAQVEQMKQAWHNNG